MIGKIKFKIFSIKDKFLLCSPVFVPQITGGLLIDVDGPVTVKVSVLECWFNIIWEKNRLTNR